MIPGKSNIIGILQERIPEEELNEIFTTKSRLTLDKTGLSKIKTDLIVRRGYFSRIYLEYISLHQKLELLKYAVEYYHPDHNFNELKEWFIDCPDFRRFLFKALKNDNIIEIENNIKEFPLRWQNHLLTPYKEYSSTGKHIISLINIWSEYKKKALEFYLRAVSWISLEKKYAFEFELGSDRSESYRTLMWKLLTHELIYDENDFFTSLKLDKKDCYETDALQINEQRESEIINITPTEIPLQIESKPLKTIDLGPITVSIF